MKRKISILLCTILLAGVFFTGYAPTSGIGNVLYNSGSTIFDNADYSQILAMNSSGKINQRAFAVTANLQTSKLEPYVYEGQVRGMFKLDKMVSNIEAQGYKVVAGINGDLYDMATGTPKGLSMHNGKIKSGGYASTYIIAFDSNGKAKLLYDCLRYYLNGSTPIHYFNVPHGSAKGLHLYNSTYGANTGTTAKSTEVIANITSGGEPTIGGTIQAKVSYVKQNTMSTPIGSNQIALSAANGSSSQWVLNNMKVGQTINVSVKDIGNPKTMTDVQEAVGVYHLLYSGGKYYSSGNNREPRTCMGIKPDGSVLIYAVDGRRSSRAGLSLTEAAKHLVSLGCSVVVNMDGGGSTTLNAREAGKDYTAVQKNSPSGGTQRAVTNGLFFVYKKSNATGEKKVATYVNNHMAMPGSYIYTTNYELNSNYENVGKKATGVTYGAFTNGCSVVDNNGVFIGGNTGKNTFVSSLNGCCTVPVPVYVWNNVKHKCNYSSISTTANKSVDINMSATYYGLPIACRDGLYQWTCDESIGTITNSSGVFTAANRTGIKRNITVTYGSGTVATIPVIIGFRDVVNHWAQPYIEKLWLEKIVNGDSATKYSPQRNVSRAEFVKLLAESVGADISSSAGTNFTDVNKGKWYYKYINWAVENGIAKGTGNNKFKPTAGITREEMCVMLANSADAYDAELPVSETTKTFPDSNKIHNWAKDSVTRIVSAGIVGGNEKGYLNPRSKTLRSEAAKVVSVFYDIMYE